MLAVYQLAVSTGIALLTFGFWNLGKLFYQRWSSPLRSLPGPKSSHWLFGNSREIFKAVRIIHSLTIINPDLHIKPILG